MFVSFALVALMGFNIVSPFLGLSEVNARLNADSLLELHNIQRLEEDLHQLTISPELNASASKKAQDMLVSDCWSHYCPDGREPWEYFDEANYDYIFAGENLAEGFYSNYDVMQAWMDSPTHRENVLSDKFDEIGFGFARGEFQDNPNNTIIVVHFGFREDTAFASYSERGELNSPEILSPSNQSYISEEVVNVYGKSPNAESVTLYLNGDNQYIASADEGIFTYRLENLPEQKYTLIAQSGKDNRTSSYSEQVTFTVDRTPDQLTAKDFAIYRDITTKELRLDWKELSGVQVISNGSRVEMERNIQGIWYLPFSEITSERVEIEVTDLAGNTSINYINTNEVPNYSNTPALNIYGISIQSIVNILVITMIIIVLLIDIYYMKKHNEEFKETYKHLHIGLLIALVIVIVLNQIGGEILTGIQS